MIEKTIGFILGHTNYKILGTSRTDAKVSANHSAFELFVNEDLDIDRLHTDFNQNLPGDIRVKKIEAVDSNFNIINTPKTKTYLYLFSFGGKCHPFCAPLMTSFQEDLDLNLMKQGAALFKGTHNFINYCTKPTPGTRFVREIVVSKIKKNTLFKANFFPDESWAYQICSKGFLRYQVRLIMGQLIRLGRGDTCLSDIQNSLEVPGEKPLRQIAPSSGLILDSIEFD